MNKVLLTYSVICLIAAYGFSERRRALEDISTGDTLAWARHITGQDVNDPNSHDYFRSVAVVPGSATKPSGEANHEDNVYICVQRDINNVTVKTIELFTPVDWGQDPNYCWFVDCAAGDRLTLYQPGQAGTPAIPGTPTDYPTLRATTDQADPGLTHTTAIANVTDLQAMNDNLTGNYYLTGNIDASATSGWNGGAGFVPIGTALAPFTGTFDGCDYTISGLTINRSASSEYQGLFGSISGTSQVANVTLSDVDITAGQLVGALAGRVVDNGSTITIQNCHASGSVKFASSASNQYWMGGMFGEVFGEGSQGPYIYDCSSSCTVDASGATGTNGNIGGFSGQADIKVLFSNCYATGNVTGTATSYSVGGFIGQNAGATTYQYCYALGDVTGNLSVGGFCGRSSNSQDTFNKCMARGEVTGIGATADRIGGFIGQMPGLFVEDCYSWGNVSSAISGANVGGFCGSIIGEVGQHDYEFKQAYSIGTVTAALGTAGGFAASVPVGTNALDVYWDTEASGVATSAIGEGQITTWLKTKTNYPATWDFDTIWYMEEIPDIPEVPAVPEAWLTNDGIYLDTVCVYADAAPRGSFTMDGNDILNFTEADYSIVIAGLNYYSIYESFPLTKDKTRIANVAIDFYETLGGNVGVDRTHSDDWQFSKDDFATQLDPMTEIKFGTFPRGWSNESRLYLWLWEPIPMTVRGMYPTFEAVR